MVMKGGRGISIHNTKFPIKVCVRGHSKFKIDLLLLFRQVDLRVRLRGPTME